MHTPFPLAAMDDSAILILVIVLAVAIGLGIAILIMLFLSSCLKVIPPQYRQQQPGMVWLLLIPLFNIVWNFFVYPKIAKSFQACLEANGNTNEGDCGAGLAMTYCILVCAGMLPIPIINGLIGIATLVVWIILLVRFGRYKKLVQRGGFGSGSGFPVQTTSAPR